MTKRKNTKRETSELKAPKPRRRYGIGEWYGRIFTSISTIERQKLAEVQFQAKKHRPRIPCPFRHSGKEQAACTKEGGVCSLKLYQLDSSLNVATVVQGDLGALVTTCPYRFQENSGIYKWVGETLLGHSAPSIASEIGFLEQVTETEAASGQVDSDDVGRIDSVLVHPTSSPLSWCALEIQSVYFSGSSMKKEFDAFRSGESPGIPFPVAHRRPDFRSSGPKRLMPQLQIKVPTLRRWGKKMAVVVDRSFFNSLGKMEEIKDVSNCDIAWFVVRYDENGVRASLKPDFLWLTTLERAVEGLTGGTPVGLSEFETRIQAKLAAAT